MWDIQHTSNLFDTHKNISDACADYMYEYIFDNFGTIDGIIAAVSCTDFAVSGARWFAEKDAKGDTAQSVELVWQTLRIIDICMPDFWCIENPISRIHTFVPEVGKPKMYFNPCDFGEPYTKKTALYGQFNTSLQITPVLPLEGSKMHRL
jgi:hypothetical protein